MKVALLSDIHANIYALEAAYEDLLSEKVERVLIAGDLIGYYYWPGDVVELLMSDRRVSCVRGNHEDILGLFFSDEGAATRYRKKYGSGYDCCVNALSQDQITWLLGLPESISIEIDGVGFHVSHGSLSDPEEYIYPDADFKKLAANYSEKMFTVFGHTHYPFIHSVDGRFIVNPGSVGQPRDAGGMASYVIVNTDNCSIQFRRCLFETKNIISMAKKLDPKLVYLRDVMSR